MHPNRRPVRYIRHDRPENNSDVETLAIIGTGIAGLGCAHALQRRFALTLYEQGGHVGGHAHTVQVEDAAGTIPIDTGFMTFNHVTYPQLTRLFGALGVATQPSSMSFSVQHRPAGLEFCGSSLDHLFGQRRNLISLRFWRMLLTIDRFKAAFFSIGSNDLAQYVTACDRSNGTLAALIDPLNPAVLDLIGRVAEFGARSGIAVSLCGDMAGDPRCIPALLSRGLRELSTNPSALAHTKRTINELSRRGARRE